MVWRGVEWSGVAWRGVVWCGVVWCGVIWHGNLNSILLHHHPPPPTSSLIPFLFTVGVDLFFTVVFTIEAVLKIISLRWEYFKDPWNK